MASSTYEVTARRLASTIRRRRRELGLTQEDVAHEAGLSVRHYQYLESGRFNPTLKTLCQLARVFAEPLDVLLREGKQR
ncbi:MAG: helix-turn-helix transcriptional regulator [Vulcanimicrobiaceae bacterium]